MCVCYVPMCVPIYIHTCVHVYPHIWPFLVAQLEESTSNAGDSSSIPGLGRSLGEGIGCTLQLSWAPLVA